MSALNSKPRVTKAEHIVGGKDDLLKLFTEMLDAASHAETDGTRIALSLTLERGAHFHTVLRTAEVRRA
jgi:hypothetical protein